MIINLIKFYIFRPILHIFLIKIAYSKKLVEHHVHLINVLKNVNLVYFWMSQLSKTINLTIILKNYI